jgi:hypothetical protein
MSQRAWSGPAAEALDDDGSASRTERTRATKSSGLKALPAAPAPKDEYRRAWYAVVATSADLGSEIVKWQGSSMFRLSVARVSKSELRGKC